MMVVSRYRFTVTGSSGIIIKDKKVTIALIHMDSLQVKAKGVEGKMKRFSSSFWIVLLLTILSLFFYAIQILAFDSPRDTGFYILQDFAFLPLQIAIVTVVLGKYLKSREKNERLKKINMVINAFFSEAGMDILMSLTVLCKNCENYICTCQWN